MNSTLNKDRELDDLALSAGGYFAIPSEESIAYTELLFSVCEQFGIRYYTATEKERCFVEEVTRVTWEIQRQKQLGITKDIRPAFSA